MAADTTDSLFMMTLTLGSKLALHLRLLLMRSLNCCVSEHSHSQNEITDKEFQCCRSEVFAVCFKNLEIIFGTYIDTGVFVSFMSIDMSYFQQFSQLRDVDKDHSAYIEKEELDMRVFSWICPESRNNDEQASRSSKQIELLMEQVSENVMNYCDVDKDGRLSKTELNRFSNYMQNMKCIDKKDCNIAAKQLDNSPLNTTMKSVLTHLDSVTPNESILADLNKQSEEEWQH